MNKQPSEWVLKNNCLENMTKFVRKISESCFSDDAGLILATILKEDSIM